MKKSIKKLFVLFILGFFVIGGTLYFTKHDNVNDNTLSSNDNAKNNTLSSNVKVSKDEVVVVAPLNDAHIDAIYSDGFKSLDDLINNSDLVVRCTIINQQYHKAGFSVISTLNIGNIISGDINVDETDIDVLQIKGDNVLKTNEEYILFLGKQDEISNEYYIIGYGTQGIFEIENNQIIPIDEVMNSEYNNLSLTENKSYSKSSDAIDNFINYIISVKN